MKNIRYTILVIFSLFLFQDLNAQDKGKSFIGISSGLAFPTGQFAKSDYGTFGHENDKAGFGKTGFNITLDGAYYFLPKIGWGGIASFMDHGGLNNSDVNKLAAGYTDAFGVAESTVEAQGRYRTINLMTGPYLSFPLKKFTLDFRAVAGVVKSLSTPTITVTLEDQSTFTQRSSTAAAFGWQAGAGARYALSNTFSLSLRGDYFQTSGIKISNDNRTNNAGRLVTKQPLAGINIAIGVSYSFRNRK
ncbi:MAG TPA: outer membrane beta-barrel protein [Cytophagaceae bacterium]|jgi:hypothetical protein|nr:outer membrane beta-barrel protein [Cytophagaceae bacterium]